MLLRLYRSVGDIFSNSIAFTVINKNGKGGVVHISIVCQCVKKQSQAFAYQ